jgi:hypothetical protein
MKYAEKEEPMTTQLTADDYLATAERRRRRFLWGGALLAVIMGISFIAYGIDNILLPLTLLVCILTPILLWRYPRMALYTVYVAVCLFEIAQTGAPDALTDRVPFFWDVNTIFQTYAHKDFKAVPLNLLEVFLLTAALCSVIHAVFSGTTRVRTGLLFLPIAAYMAFVAWGWVNGVATGGDFKISLQEVRAQFYFLLGYLMAVNLVQEKRQIGTLFWITALCIGLKGILYTFRRYVTLAGQPLPDQGVGSHEEAFFFDVFVSLLVILALCGVQKKLQWVMWSLLPFVLLGNLATNRRAGTAALVVIVPILLLSAYRALPQRRRFAGILAVVLAVGGSLYYQAFKNSNGMIGEPARAIASQFEPDARDASSDAYRDAENADLMATIKTAPVQGYGYGKRMIHAVPIADISADYEWWDIMTHNQILWVWMRVGTVGFWVFWMMISAILIRAAQTARAENADLETKAAGIFVLAVVGMLMIFGLLDLQLSNFRDMLFAAFWAGILVSTPMIGIAPWKESQR